MVTVLVELGQGGFEMVHINTFAPAPNPVTVVVGDPGVVIVPAPLTKVQVPVPTAGVFPASVAVLLQMVWFGPARAVDTGFICIMMMVSVDGAQGGLEIVHTKTFGPTDNPVTPEVGEDGVVTVAVPPMTVHAPVPVRGVFPANVAVVLHTV